MWKFEALSDEIALSYGVCFFFFLTILFLGSSFESEVEALSYEDSLIDLRLVSLSRDFARFFVWTSGLYLIVSVFSVFVIYAALSFKTGTFGFAFGISYVFSISSLHESKIGSVADLCVVFPSINES